MPRHKPNAVTGGSKEPLARGYVNGRYVGSKDKAKTKPRQSQDASQMQYQGGGKMPLDRAAPGGSKMPSATYSKDKSRGDGAGRAVASGKDFGTEGNISEASGTSIFDPVLCEIAYRWFCPQGGTVLDPFAGGSVRGIVASHLGRQYVGVELRQEQVEANRAQEGIAKDPMPVWHCGDSANIDSICKGVKADLVFSCPPYADLEVYSEDPKDLSTMAYDDFKPAYFDIIAKSCSLLKQDAFACFVVGDVRDKKGNYYNFVGDTVEAFKAAGLHYYNEAILITAIGSLPVRAGRVFTSSRKLGKTHQNVLVFVKGDGKRAASNCGEVEFGEIAEEFGEEL